MKQNSKRLSSMIFSLIFLVGALVVYFELLSPAYGNLQELKGQELSEQQFLANEQQIVTQVQQLVSSYESQAQGEQSVALALPIGEDTAGALAQIYGLSAIDNVSVQTIGVSNQPAQAQTPVVGAVALPTDSNGQIATAAGGGNILKPVGSLTFQIGAVGSYENFKLFLQGLESNIRIFDVKGVSVYPTAFAGSGKAGTQDLFQYTVTIATYYQTP